MFFVFSCGPLGEARKQYESENYAAAITLLRVEIAKDSTNAEAYILLARSFERQTKSDSAIHAYERALHFDAENPSAKAALTRCYLEKANGFRESGESHQAIVFYGDAERLSPRSFEIFFERGQAYLKFGMLDKAREQFIKAAEIAPNDPRSQQELQKLTRLDQQAQALFQQGQEEYNRSKWLPAIAKFEDAVKLKADFTDAQYLLCMAKGQRLYQKGSVSDLWDAITQYGQATNLHPESTEPYYFMALAYEKKDRNDFVAPVEFYQKVVAMDPQGPYTNKALERIKYLVDLKDKRERFWGKKKK